MFDKISTPQKESLKNIYVCLILFIFAILTVAHILPYYVLVLIVTVTLLFFDKKVFALVDYSLLFTFVGFFVFIGNIERIDFFKNFFSAFLLLLPVEFSSIFASQIISNVPAALLLSGFTQNVKGLIIGTNLGGLGTLIASMASLISYKFFAVENPQNKKQYVYYFTFVNILFLFCELLLWLIIK